MDLESSDEIPKKPSVFYIPKVWYAITIAPTDKYQFAGKELRMTRFKNFINEQLMVWTKYKIQYHFNMELSEPKLIKSNSIGPRLHLHGMIRFKCRMAVLKFLTNVLYDVSRFAQIDIDSINDMGVWYNYITKQEEIFKCYIDPVFTNVKIKQHTGELSESVEDDGRSPRR